LTTVKIIIILYYPNFFPQITKRNKEGLCVDRGHRNVGAVVFSFTKFNNTIVQCEQCEVFSNTNIFSRMINCTTLTNDDVTGDGGLSTEDLYSKALAL